MFEIDPTQNVLNPDHAGFHIIKRWRLQYENPGPEEITIIAFAECAKLVDVP